MQSYIQYINKKGTIKAVEVERQEVGQKVRYVLPTIQEQFFILTAFDNNKRVLGLGFVDVENLDMLAFLNSDFQSVEALPEIAYFNAYQEIILETDLVIVQNDSVVSVDNFPATQNVNVTNQPTQIAVSNFPPTQNVNVTNQPTQIAVSNFPSTQNVNVNNVPTVIIQNSNIFKVYYQSAAKNFIINDLPENAKNLILQASTLLTFTVNTSVVPKLIQYVDSNSFSTTYDLFCGTATTDIEVSIDGVGWINVPIGQVFIAKKMRGKSTGTGALGQITGYQLYL